MFFFRSREKERIFARTGAVRFILDSGINLRGICFGHASTQSLLGAYGLQLPEVYSGWRSERESSELSDF